MTGWFIFLAYVAAINPPQLRPQLTAGEERGRLLQVAAGASLVAGVGLILVLGAEGVLGALDITDETWRLAAGVVCGLVGARAVAAPKVGDNPLPPRSAVVPIAFPLLFTPQLAVLAVLFGATESFIAAGGWLTVAVGSAVATGALGYRRPRLWLALSQFLAALLVVVGVALVIAGIRDV